MAYVLLPLCRASLYNIAGQCKKALTRQLPFCSRPQRLSHRQWQHKQVTCQAHERSMSMSSAKKPRQIAKFCSSCGGKIELAVPGDETEWRHVCMDCHAITYYNPKMVVGVICEHEGKILLCKRGIEPCKGLWTIPAGYMEMGESSAEGAIRETMEEAQAAVEIIAPYAHFDIPRIGQSYVLFRAKLLAPFTFGPTHESLETIFLPPNELPFDKIAFSSVSIALQYYTEEAKTGLFKIHHGVIEKAEGAAPNDPSSYRLRDHLELAANL